MFSISFRKYRDAKEKINLFTLIIKMKILFARQQLVLTVLCFYCDIETLLLSKLLFCIPTTQKMMSEMQTRLKHLFETAIMMTSSKMTACRICRKNKVRKSTGESSRHGLAHCNGHQKDQAGGSHKEPKMFSHLFYSTLLLSHLEQKLVKTKIRPAFPQNGS